MACTEDINNYFQSESNRITRETFKINWVGTPWDSNTLVPKTDWPDGMGETPNMITWNRSLPIGGVSFAPVSFNDGSGNQCSPAASIVYQSTTRRSMQLEKAAIESERICNIDARLAWDIVQQGAHILENLQEVTRNVWQNQRRDDFTDVCSNKAVADASMTTNSSSFATGVTIGQLTREMLDYWYNYLTQRGAHINNGLATSQYDQPVLPLVLSREAQYALITADQTVNNIRWDASLVNRLNAPQGSFVNLNGFRMMIDMQAARWNLVGGNWVRVPFYLQGASPGDEAVVNPAYQTADYEDLYICSPKVVQFAIPKSAFPSGPMSFRAQDYMGAFEWLNIRDNTCNQDGNTGYFRANYMYAPRPGIPSYGAVLRFRRCPENWVVDATCS